MRTITRRDGEILRSLLRVQLASTGSLQRTFFPDLRGARKRLRVLRTEYGYIVPHSRGLPGDYAGQGGHYWRLTQAGLRKVIDLYPEEHIPNRHVRRCRSASLRSFEHRDAIADVYLGLIAASDGDCSAIVRRASQIEWRPEHEVELTYQGLDGAARRKRCTVPDATLTTTSARYFLEIDCSTESHTYCKRTLKNYGSAIEGPAYARQFPDGLPPVVVYITKSEGRAENLMQTIRGLPRRGLQAVALPVPRALEWLSEAIDTATGVPPLDPTTEADRLLLALYNELTEHVSARQAAGERISPSTAMAESYEYLQARHKRRAA